MEKKRNWKAWGLIALAVLAVLQVLPTFVPNLPEFYTQLFKQEISFGLDLKGGLELKYTVDYKKAIGDNVLRLRDAVTDRLVDAVARKKGADPETMTEKEKAEIAKRFEIKRGEGTKRAEGRRDLGSYRLEIAFKDPAERELLTKDLVDTIDSRFVLSTEGDNLATLELPDQEVAVIREEIVRQTLDVIRKRVDAFGLVEPDVRRSGDADIMFRMADETATTFDEKREDVEQFKAARTEEIKTLRWESAYGSGETRHGAFLRAEKKGELVKYLKHMGIPDNVVVGYEYVEQKDPITAEVRDRFWRTWNLKPRAELTGDNLTRSALGYGQKGEPVVNLEFDTAGAKVFGDLTGANVGKLMAIMLDDEVSSAPRINERIDGGRCQITMGGGRAIQQILDDARALVTVLNNGAYKAPVVKVHDVEIGPSLGRDAVRSGMISIVAGFILVVVFMAWYYRQAGWIANIALTFNLLLIVACLVAFSAALTLPGMAGIVLTLGMAVDANVLIYERIREEVRNKRTPRNAVELGYGKAFWSIFDSQLTTAIAGFVLMLLASGPIYGFAVTLLVGILTSMFTGIIVTRVIYNHLLDSGKLEDISI
jgi:preprotein translocase subunit SecD